MIPVKAVEHDGDWFLIPNEKYQDFLKLTEELTSDEENHELQEEFETKFGSYRTGGDLNLVQLFIQ